SGVFRPSRRSKSSKFCSTGHGADRNGTAGKKWARKISPVQKKQINARTNNPRRPSHSMCAESYQLRAIRTSHSADSFRDGDGARPPAAAALVFFWVSD